MTSQPASSSERPTLPPPRHSASLGVSVQDTTEHDLWAFDGDEQASAVDPPTSAVAGSVVNLPVPRDSSLEKMSAAPPVAGKGLIRLNVNKSASKTLVLGSLAEPAPHEDAFGELESWDDLEPPSATHGGSESHLPMTPSDGVTPVVPMAEEELTQVESPRAAPIFLDWQLSRIEKIGLISLLILLLGGGGGMWVFSLKHLPTDLPQVAINDFPLHGKCLTIDAVTSYWRAPIRAGASLDKVRRGTQLLPVLEIKVGRGVAALRVLFRNQDRVVVGDAVTRTVSGAGALQIPATAGFDDLGMHAAYRAGESKPWTVEVLEAPSDDTAGPAFTKLFEINIATDRH